MKLATIITCFLLLGTNIYSQVIEQLKHCNCSDKIETLLPVLNGNYERKCANKIIETGTFKEGKKDGIWTTYTPSGTVIRKIVYTDGKLNGKVELFYPNGKQKLVTSFVNNERNGSWIFYTKKGKVRISGEYTMDKPINIWTIKDFEGKKIEVQYDFSNSSYLKNEPVPYHKNWDVVQNDNTTDFFLLFYPDRIEPSGTAPLGGYLLASDLFVDLMEIPIDFFNTYTHKNFIVDFSIKPNHISTFILTETAEIPDDIPLFPFLAKTNDTDKLHHVEHSNLSNLLLASKINEALLFMPPWIYQNQEKIKLYIPYVLNDIKGIDVIEK